MAKLPATWMALLAFGALPVGATPLLAAERPPGTYTSENTGIAVVPPAGFRFSRPYMNGARVSIDATPVSGFPTSPSPRSLCTYTFVTNSGDNVYSVASYERMLLRNYQTQVTLQYREEFTNPQGAHGLELMLRPLLIDFVLLYNTVIEFSRGRVELVCGLLQSEGSAAVRAVRYLVDAITIPVR